MEYVLHWFVSGVLVVGQLSCAAVAYIVQDWVHVSNATSSVQLSVEHYTVQGRTTSYLQCSTAACNAISIHTWHGVWSQVALVDAAVTTALFIVLCVKQYAQKVFLLVVSSLFTCSFSLATILYVVVDVLPVINAHLGVPPLPANGIVTFRVSFIVTVVAACVLVVWTALLVHWLVVHFCARRIVFPMD